MTHRRMVRLLALGIAWAALPMACAPAPLVATPLAREPSPGAAASPSPSPTASATVPASASAAAPQVAPAADAPPSAPSPSAEPPPPPCIDGEILMGTCLCDKGKGADATGHCVFMPCPRSSTGGTAFRDKTGQCRECRAGTTPTPDGDCLR